MKLRNNWLIAGILLFMIHGIGFAKFKKKETKPDKKKATTVGDFRNKLTINRASMEVYFPDKLEFDFISDGEEVLKSKANRLSDTRSLPTIDSQGRKKTRGEKREQYYVDDNGSYKVSADVRWDGTLSVNTKATYRTEAGEKCFLARGESHCWNIDGEGELGLASLEEDEPELPAPSRANRQGRQLIYSDFTPSRVLKVAYVVDKAFMDWFREISGNDDTAIEDAEDYIYMLNNELTYLYRGIKEVSEANDSIQDMDIVVYAQGFYFPVLGTDWYWLEPFVSDDGILATGPEDDALEAFGRWVGRGNVALTGPFDTATFLTPRRLLTGSGGWLLGIAWSRTTCNSGYRNYQVSMNEDRFFDVALSAAHEIGHSIGARHDGSNGLSCPSGKHIMSKSVFRTSTANKDTWNRWSTCSVSDIVAHVSRFSGCLIDGNPSEEAFLDQLCKGVRGTNQFDANYQCKTATKDMSSTVCSPSVTVNTGKVPAEACWDDRQASLNCTDSIGNCNVKIFTIFDGTPCTGPDNNNKYVCYRGDCVEQVNVCSGRGSTTSTSTTSSTPTTTTTTTTTTTPRPTMAPPLPPSCSCDSGSSFRRWVCCRTEKNTDGSCCSGCRRSRNRCTTSRRSG